MNKEQARTKIKKKTKADFIAIANRVVVLAIIACGVVYLGGTNDLAIKHFVVQENKRKLYGLKEDNTQLEAQVMALSSFSTINKKVANLKMVKVDRVEYLNLNQAVARR